tara:strand:- start:301 stop:606 length:306 start_codon:yes stop_codon:yes gene_type:complete
MAKTQVILGEMNLEGNRKMAFGTITQDAATTELVLTGWTTVEMMTTSPMGNGVRAAGTATHSIDEVFPVGAVVTDGVKADNVTLTLDIVSDELIGWICIGQ